VPIGQPGLADERPVYFRRSEQGGERVVEREEGIASGRGQVVAVISGSGPDGIILCHVFHGEAR
jgi:hypothetical protein